jgi:hypothetical protein
VVQCVGPELKSQYHKNRKRKLQVNIPEKYRPKIVKKITTNKFSTLKGSYTMSK